MSSKKSRIGAATWPLFLIGSLVLLFFMAFRRKVTFGSPKSTIQNLLRQAGYSDNVAKWWAAVSDHETATWTSNLFKTHNNLFGMKQPKKRATLSAGEVAGGFASFRSIEDSVGDLILYMQEWGYPKNFFNLESMIDFMKSKGYFEDDLMTYYNSVKARL
jgi:hypothetical protein